MQQLGPFLVIGGVVSLIGGIVYLAWLMEKKRTEAMTAFAQSHGYVFEGVSPNLISELSTFKLFNQGRARTVKNLMRGSKEPGAVRICDYQYTTGSGKHQQVHQQTICVLKTPGRNAPHFFLRKQNKLFDALGKLFGGQDINFDDDPTFSKTYVLQTSGDEQQLRGFMSVGLRETLSRMADRNIMMEVMGDTLVLHHGRRLKPDQLEALVADAVNIRRQWSWEQLRHVIFFLDRDRYALPLDAVREVVNAPEHYSRVPHAKDAVKGVMTLRGRVVPVVDLGRLLSLGVQPPGKGKVVLLELVRRELGLLVTEVEGIESIEKVGAQGRASRVVRGIARVGPLTVTVLDLEGVDAAVTASFS